MPLATLIRRSSLPCPHVSLDQARSLLAQHYGLNGTLKVLGSQQDCNLLLDTGTHRYVLKVCHGDYSPLELEAQHAALQHLAGQPGIRVPEVISACNGEKLLSLNLDGQAVHARLLEFIDGQSLGHAGYLGREVVIALGELCARVDTALHDFSHPGLERVLQWDPRHANALARHLLPVIDDTDERACLHEAVELARQRLMPLIPALPLQAVHLDITEHNVVWARDAHRHWQLQGLIDFGDLLTTWRVADLSVTCAALLHHAGGDPLYILPAISAYHALNPLRLEELKALWPLIVARATVLVLSSEQQVSVEPGNAYIQANLDSEWSIFDVATSVPMALMEAAILHAVGLDAPPAVQPAWRPLLPDLAGRGFCTVDLGVLSEHFEAGNWERTASTSACWRRPPGRPGWPPAAMANTACRAPCPTAAASRIPVPCTSSCTCRPTPWCMCRSAPPCARPPMPRCGWSARPSACGCGAWPASCLQAARWRQARSWASPMAWCCCNCAASPDSHRRCSPRRPGHRPGVISRRHQRPCWASIAMPRPCRTRPRCWRDVMPVLPVRKSTITRHRHRSSAAGAIT